jgi:hypothetical protein
MAMTAVMVVVMTCEKQVTLNINQLLFNTKKK